MERVVDRREGGDLVRFMERVVDRREGGDLMRFMERVVERLLERKERVDLRLIRRQTESQKTL